MFVDTFRYFHPNQEGAFTCWSTVTGARATNYGTRIDYILADIKLTRDRFHNCVIMPDVQGSDHCPVKATLNLKVVAAKKCPPLCTKWLPEFSGKQQKLSAFFTKSSTVTNSMNSSSKQFQSGQKRSGSVSPKGPMVKRQKTGGSQKPSIQKQGSLLTFFNRSEKSNPDSGAASDRQNETTVEMDFNSGAYLNSSQCQNSSSCSKKLNIKHLSRSETNSKAASSWKTLLKGPPQAPNCKGHKEPCVLRTVKKDGPNKGRQFWVCNRPEGHKSNPEARCEHFVWIKK